jgi:hypothetical protein
LGLKLFGFFGIELGESAVNASVRRERRETKVKEAGLNWSQNNISVFVLHFSGNHTITALAAGFSRNARSRKIGRLWWWLITVQ